MILKKYKSGNPWYTNYGRPLEESWSK